MTFLLLAALTIAHSSIPMPHPFLWRWGPTPSAGRIAHARCAAAEGSHSPALGGAAHAALPSGASREPQALLTPPTPPTLALQEAAATIGDRLMQDAAVKAAIDRVRRDEAQVIEEQVRLCEIPAPPFKETARAGAYRQAFQAAGLKNVRIDRVGNVLGERPGLAPTPHLVLSAHLDTVFPEETKVQTTNSWQGTARALLLAIALAQR